MDKRTTTTKNNKVTTTTVQRTGSRTSARAGVKTSGQTVTRTITKVSLVSNSRVSNLNPTSSNMVDSQLVTAFGTMRSSLNFPFNQQPHSHVNGNRHPLNLSCVQTESFYSIDANGKKTLIKTNSNTSKDVANGAASTQHQRQGGAGGETTTVTRTITKSGSQGGIRTQGNAGMASNASKTTSHHTVYQNAGISGASKTTTKGATATNYRKSSALAGYMDTSIEQQATGKAMAKTGSKAQLVGSANRYQQPQSSSFQEFRATASITPSKQVDLTQIR